MTWVLILYLFWGTPAAVETRLAGGLTWEACVKLASEEFRRLPDGAALVCEPGIEI
jgi:hypothetical protein